MVSQKTLGLAGQHGMTPVFCSRCQRANPPDSQFCHFDGTGLRNGVDGKAPTQTGLGREFVFPSGRRCRTFDELVAGCSQEWSTARSLLQKGSMRQFLASIGRMDLAHQADKAAAHVDPDLGLDLLLSAFPTKETSQPRLDLAPRRLHLGAIKAGDSRDLLLQVLNRGSRLLHGAVEVRGENWLRVGSDGGGMGTANGKLPIKTGQQQECPIHIETQGLPAGQPYAATLAVLTNGGTAEVPVTFELMAIPFPHAPLADAATPRDLAARMKEMPKPSCELLEKGEVERWFMLNGWRYPVTGPTAQGVAAVQQFFEGMGLSKPPALTLQPSQLELSCKAGGTVRAEVNLQTSAKKWVFAFLEADVPWIKPGHSQVAGGQTATVAFQVSSRGLAPASRHQGTLQLIGNGGQRLQVRVGLNVAPAAHSVQRFLQPLVTGFLGGMLLRVGCILPDQAARNWQPERPEDYVRSFSIFSFWLMILILWFAIRHTGKFRDFLAALGVGSLGGLLLASTLAQILPWVDQVIPWGTWPGSAVLTWGILGGWLGLVAALLTGRGRAAVQSLGEIFGRCARWLRLKPLANLLEI
jgi:hypothetical protein